MHTADGLLAGPRGRLLCWAVLWLGLPGEISGSAAWLSVWGGVNAGDLSGHLDELASIVALADPAALAADSATVLEALGWTVDAAAYWQESGPEDRALASGGAAEALRPVAEALATAASGPALCWWDSPADLER